MQCGDLERYLEAFLDGRLGRSRSAILRRHLAICGGCRARVERLRQFEREMQRRFRSMEQTGSLWQGLELDLVASSRAAAVHHLLALPRPLPPSRGAALDGPPPPSPKRHHPLLAKRATGRGRASGLAGIVLIAMALGAVYQFASPHLGAGAGDDPVAQAYGALVRDEHTLALHSDDAGHLRDWLAHELDRPVPTPPVPPGFHLIGADRAELGTGEAGALVYGRTEAAPDAAAVVLFVQPLPADAPVTTAMAAAASVESDLQALRWEADRLRYTAVGRGTPEEELRRFAP
jgi:anti-sigma factor RsiW